MGSLGASAEWFRYLTLSCAEQNPRHRIRLAFRSACSGWIWWRADARSNQKIRCTCRSCSEASKASLAIRSFTESIMRLRTNDLILPSSLAGCMISLVTEKAGLVGVIMEKGKETWKIAVIGCDLNNVPKYLGFANTREEATKLSEERRNNRVASSHCVRRWIKGSKEWLIGGGTSSSIPSSESWL